MTVSFNSPTRPTCFRSSLVLGLAVVLAIVLRGVSGAAEAGTPRAVFPDGKYDFGTVKQGEKISHCFAVRNEGSAPLKTGGMQLPRPEMVARAPASLAPGHDGKVCVELDTSSMSREVHTWILVMLNDPATPKVQLYLNGIVKAPIDLVPMGAVFATLWKGEGGQSTVTIVNNRPKPLQVRGLNVEGQDFKARLDTQKAGKVYKLVVTIPHDLAPGYYTGTVYVNTDSADYARIGIPINILVKNEIYTFPLGIKFGSIGLAQIDSNPAAAADLEQWVLVKKRAGKFGIKSIRSDLPGLKITQTPEGESNTFRVDVALSKGHLQPGSLDGKIRVLTDDPAIPEVIVPVSGQIR